MPIDMFPRTIENRLKIGRYVPILRHQSARIEPCGVRGVDVMEQIDIANVSYAFSAIQCVKKVYKNMRSKGS